MTRGKANDSSFILVGDYEEFCMKNIIDPAMEKHAADLGVTMSEFKKLLAEDAKEGAIMRKHADELGVTLREYKSMLAGDTMEEARKKEHKRMMAEGRRREL
jgi:Sec-independent protein translocase protein TatA